MTMTMTSVIPTCAPASVSRRIAIANADAGANAMFETAVEQGHRAVAELT